jgi:hypothetical protein
MFAVIFTYSPRRSVGTTISSRRLKGGPHTSRSKVCPQLPLSG